MKAVSLTVDGKRIYAAAGTTILEAARKNGIEIPTLCYHPRLRPLGHCRLCLVEVEGVAAPVTSCDNPVQEGMVVTTSTPQLEAMRKEIISLLLSDHPYEECLTCEKSGACELQEKAYACRVDLPGLVRALPVTDDENPYIVRDEAKCILCGRCLRVCRDYAGRSVFALLSGGIDSRIAPFREGGAVSLEEAGCIFCGQCADVCPVGALTEKERASSGREWELAVFPGVCLECSLGCAVERRFAGGKPVKVTAAREGEKSGWICRKGKFVDSDPDSAPVTAPLIRGEEGFSEVSYEEALLEASRSFLEIKKKRGSSALAVLGGGCCSNEESYLLQKLARGAMGTNHVDLGVKPAWAEAARALEAVTGPGACGPSTADLQNAGAIFVIGRDLGESNPVAAMAVEQACRFGKAVLIQIGTAEKELTAWERLVFLPPRGSEAALFEALAGVLQDRPVDETVNKAGVDRADLNRAARLLGGTKAVILVCPSFFETAGSDWFGPLVTAAETAGQLERGRSNLLLLAEEGNARGILEAGGTPRLLPGYSPLEGEAGFDRAKVIAAAGSGGIKGIFACMEGLNEPLPEGLDFLAVLCSRMSDIPAGANVVFPAPPIRLKEGSFTSSAGRWQANLNAADAAHDIRPEWQVICALADAMGEPSSYRTLKDLQEEICRVVACR